MENAWNSWLGQTSSISLAAAGIMFAIVLLWMQVKLLYKEKWLFFFATALIIVSGQFMLVAYCDINKEEPEKHIILNYASFINNILFYLSGFTILSRYEKFRLEKKDSIFVLLLFLQILFLVTGFQTEFNLLFFKSNTTLLLDTMITCLCLGYFANALRQNIIRHKEMTTIFTFISILFLLVYIMLLNTDFASWKKSMMFRVSYLIFMTFLFFACFIIIGECLRFVSMLDRKFIKDDVIAGHIPVTSLMKSIALHVNANYIAIYAKKDNYSEILSYRDWYEGKKGNKPEELQEDEFGNTIIFETSKVKKTVCYNYTEQKDFFEKLDNICYYPNKECACIPVKFYGDIVGFLLLAWKHPRREPVIKYLEVLAQFHAPRLQYWREFVSLQEYSKKLDNIRWEVYRDLTDASLDEKTNIIVETRTKLISFTCQIIGACSIDLILDRYKKENELPLDNTKQEKFDLVWEQNKIGILTYYFKQDSINFSKRTRVIESINERMVAALMYIENREIEIDYEKFKEDVEEIRDLKELEEIIKKTGKKWGFSNVEISTQTVKKAKNKPRQTKVDFERDYVKINFNGNKFIKLESDFVVKPNTPLGNGIQKFGELCADSFIQIKAEEEYIRNAQSIRAAAGILLKKHKTQGLLNGIFQELENLHKQKSNEMKDKIDEISKNLLEVKSNLEFMMGEKEWDQFCELKVILPLIEKAFSSLPVKIHYNLDKMNHQVALSSDLAMEIIYELVHNSEKAKLPNKVESINVYISYLKSKSNESIVHLKFEDDGIGIPENKRNSIFNTPDENKRTGRGLPRIKHFLDNSGGSILLIGDDGASFELQFPRYKEKQ